MSSPLLPYANARILVASEGAVSTSNGRIVTASGTDYVVLCFMKRAQYSGVSSGSKRLPLESQLGGQMMPGASGDSFYYRGYALQYAPVTTQDWEADPLGDFTWTQMSTQPEWMSPGKQVPFKFGDDPLLLSSIERSSGIFGGQGIDDIIYAEIGGVELQLTGGELQN
jgi:hypothetical protein